MIQQESKINKFRVVQRIILRGSAIILVCYLLFPIQVLAAVLYLSPEKGEYQPGDTFLVEVRIDTEGECINTVKAIVSFPKDVLEAKDFSTGNSILTLWVERPKIDQNLGKISFIGGIPGGYCGPLPGEPGEPNLLGRIIFKAKEVNGELFSAEIEFLETSQVLLNDGFGTPARLTTKRAIFKIAEVRPRQELKEEWKEELAKDTIPPEPFEIEIHQDPAIFEGKYFIIFSATDKQTGIDHYEIKEGKRDWKRVASPYLLEDQELKSIIKVKAVDKAGNERIVEYIPPKKPFPYWIIILILLGAGVIWWIIRKLKIKSQKSK